MSFEAPTSGQEHKPKIIEVDDPLQRTAHELLRNWAEQRQEGVSDYHAALEGAWFRLYERLSEGKGNRYISHLDNHKEGADGWDEGVWFKENEDRSGRWEFRPEDPQINEETGRILIPVHCRYIPMHAEGSDVVDDSPEREDDYQLVLQAAPEVLAEVHAYEQKKKIKREKEKGLQQRFHAFAETHLDRLMTYDEALAEADGQEDALEWGMVGNLFEIKAEDDSNWAIYIYDEDPTGQRPAGPLRDIIYRPKSAQDNEKSPVT